MSIKGKLISLSLFTGAFGLDLGLEKAGFTTANVVEIDSDSNKTIAINRPYLAKKAISRDIKKVSSSQLLEEGGSVLNLGRPLSPGEVDLITGGPPCQPFSTAGKRLSVGDPRGSLFIEFLRLVNEIKPRFFLMENVRGLLSAPIKHRTHKQRGKEHPDLEPEEMPGAALNVILAEIESIGYKVSYRLLQAADYGVPQTRLRVFFLASRDHEKITFPLPSHTKEATKKLPFWLTLKDAIYELTETDLEYTAYSAKRLKYLKLLKAGQNWRFLPEELQPEAMGGAYKSGGGKVGFYRRLSWNKPSPTITTSPHQKATDMCHPDDLRPLTVRECARIQTFPDDWIFYGSTTSKYRQIGNAVPVLLGKAIGSHLSKIIQGQDISSLGINNQLLLFTQDINPTAPEPIISSQSLQKSIMTDKQIIKILLQDAGVRKSSLVAEKISTLERYINIDEEELSEFQWIDKKGKDVPMIPISQINKIIAKRDLYLKTESRLGLQIELIKQVAAWLSDVPAIKNLLKELIPSKKAGELAKKIQSIKNIKTRSTAFSESMSILSTQEKEDTVNLFLQQEEWNYSSIIELQSQPNIFAKAISLRALLWQKESSIHNPKTYKIFKNNLLINWNQFKKEPALLVDSCRNLNFIQNDFDNQNIEKASKLLFLEPRQLDIALLLLKEIIKMTIDLPNLANKAISTANPFLFRSLFLDFKEAEAFAAGGKLNSSLETKYGNLFERLMSAFGNCYEIYDGGVDVLVGKNAFDIKSGPNVMNKSMVDAFSAKQVLIQDKNILPEIDYYQIALGYGRRENLNSFMAKIDSEILTARESWEKITGIKHSPEIVFAIAGLIPKFFGFKSIVGSILNKVEQPEISHQDDSQFQDMFNHHFDQIELNNKTKQEISKIESLLN